MQSLETKALESMTAGGYMDEEVKVRKRRRKIKETGEQVRSSGLSFIAF